MERGRMVGLGDEWRREKRRIDGVGHEAKSDGRVIVESKVVGWHTERGRVRKDGAKGKYVVKKDGTEKDVQRERRCV